MNQYRETTYETVDAWLAGRVDGFGVGASTAPAILGASSYASPWDIWARYHKPSAVGRGSSSAQRRGHAFEPLVLRAYAARFGVDVEKWYDLTVWSSARVDWARCSPDATVIVDGERGLAEIKTARGGWQWRDAPPVIESPDDLDLLPSLSYGLQCYWQLLVSGLPFVDLVVLPLSHELAAVSEALTDSEHRGALPLVVDAVAKQIVRVRINAAPKFQTRFGGLVAQWRARHLVEGIAPPAGSSASASAYYGRVAKRSAAMVVDDEHEITKTADALYRAREAKREATAAEKTISGTLKQLIADVERVETPRGVVRWKKHGRGMRLVVDDWSAREAT